MAKQTGPDWGDFQQVEDNPYRLVVRSWGPQKTGKNHFGFTAPDPIAGLYFDPGGIEGVAQKFKNGLVEGFGKKDIRFKQYRFSKSMGQDAAIEVRDQFEEDYDLALKNARTIQIDESELWAVYRWAEFDNDSDSPKEFGPLYTRYREIVQKAIDAGVNLQLIQKTKEKWMNVMKTDRNGMAKETGRPSGEFIASGMKEIPFLVQINIRHEFVKGEGFVLHIEDCRQNMELAQERFVNSTFPEIATLVFPDTTEDDWK